MKNYKVLLNPFEGYSEKSLVLTGAISFVIGSLLGYFFNGRYDGIIDLHFSEHVNFWLPFIDNLINVFALFFIFSIIGKLLNRKTRFIDILAVVLMARLPIYVISLINIANLDLAATKKLLPLASDPDYAIPFGSLTLMLIFGLISITLIAWFGALLYNGIKVSTNGKNWNLIVGVILGIILSEALSKFIFFYFF